MSGSEILTGELGFVRGWQLKYPTKIWGKTLWGSKNQNSVKVWLFFWLMFIPTIKISHFPTN
jgi:hypothetical protein